MSRKAGERGEGRQQDGGGRRKGNRLGRSRASEWRAPRFLICSSAPKEKIEEERERGNESNKVTTAQNETGRKLKRRIWYKKSCPSPLRSKKQNKDECFGITIIMI